MILDSGLNSNTLSNFVNTSGTGTGPSGNTSSNVYSNNGGQGGLPGQDSSGGGLGSQQNQANNDYMLSNM